MTTTAAALLANTLSFLLALLIAVWYLVPWLNRRSRADALTALLWFNAFRYVALELFSAQSAGLRIPNALRDQIAYGDLAVSLLAVLAIVALRYRFRSAVGLVWIFAAASAVDLTNALVSGVRNAMLGEVHDVPWLILCFYVPALWVTLGLVVWQLISRSRDPLFDSSVAG
jgi:Na+/phosphate symporter